MLLDKESFEYHVGEYILYKTTGICQITDIRSEAFKDGEERIYYVLTPINDQLSSVYIPTDSENIAKSIKRVPTVEEVEKMIEDSLSVSYVYPADIKEKAVLFDKIIHSGNRAEILWMAKNLALRKRETESQKKKFHVADTRYLSLAEKIITEDFAFVLGIDKSEVISYIIEKTETK